MEKYIITEQDIQNATASIPLVLKYTLANYISEFCMEKKQISIKEKGIDTVALPDMLQRNTMRESQYKIGVFVKEYMRKDYNPVHDSEDEPIPYLMAADEADAWSNFESQLDRLKRSKDKAIADKCYDILNDYHAFCRMVSIEIEQKLQVGNDIVGRLAWLAKSMMNEFTIEEMKKLVKEIAEQNVEEPPKEEDNGDAELV